MGKKRFIVKLPDYSGQLMEKLMDDLQELHNDMMAEQEKLCIALDKAEDGDMLTLAEIDLIRFHCGLPTKRRVNPVLSAIADDFSNIFGGKQ
jgi:hypothetical protein